MNTQPYPVATAEQRSWRYWFSDGLPNLVAGITCLLLAGGFVLLSRYKHSRSPVVFVVAALATIIYIVAVFHLRQAIEWLKARITYPRTGYAASPYFTFRDTDPLPADLTMLNLSNAERSGILPSQAEVNREVGERKHRIWLAFVIYAAAMLCAGMIQELWICGVLGAVTAMGILFGTRKNERMSWALAFGLPFAGMYMLMLAGQNPQMRTKRLAFFMAGAGLALAADGFVKLARYLKLNPVDRT